MLPRRLAKKIFRPRRHWPKALRTKWLALGLLFVFFWAYEAFDLWASPWLTAWLALAYFLSAALIDALFRGAAFCKYICPIGQFHFVNGLAAPTEVAIRNSEVCGECRTRECITGVYEIPRPHPTSHAGTPSVAAGPPISPLRMADRGRLLQNGCELWLYQETKWGNMDCTFCLECIHACPYDNVGIFTRPPARELWEDPKRAGVGRFSQRPDLAALGVFLTFAAFSNAFGMVAPAYVLEDWMGGVLGLSSGPLLLAILFLTGMVVLPGLLTALTAKASAFLSGSGRTLLSQGTRFGYALIPVGFGMWVAHYLYHFLVGGMAIFPVTQEYLADLGFPILGAPDWSVGPLVPDGWLLPLELLFLELGLLASLVVAHRIALREAGPGPRALLAAIPWWVLAILLSALGVWLLLQPMEMRGTIAGV
jgi:ferredoxin